MRSLCKVCMLHACMSCRSVSVSVCVCACRVLARCTYCVCPPAAAAAAGVAAVGKRGGSEGRSYSSISKFLCIQWELHMCAHLQQQQQPQEERVGGEGHSYNEPSFKGGLFKPGKMQVYGAGGVQGGGGGLTGGQGLGAWGGRQGKEAPSISSPVGGAQGQRGNVQVACRVVGEG